MSFSKKCLANVQKNILEGKSNHTNNIWYAFQMLARYFLLNIFMLAIHAIVLHGF